MSEQRALQRKIVICNVGPLMRKDRDLSESEPGWILLSIGAMIILFFGGYKIVEGIIQDPSTPFLLKAGILIFLGGIVVLLVSFSMIMQSASEILAYGTAVIVE